MVELSGRFVEELASRLEKAIEQKTSLDGTPAEDVTVILARLRDLGIVKLGKLRSHWLLHDKPYRPLESEDAGLIADLVLALAMIARVSKAPALLLEDGAVEFARDGRVIATFLVASGRGHRSKAGVEAAVGSRRWQRGNRTPALGVLVGGTSDLWTSETTPPRDVVRGNTIDDDLVTGATTPPMLHIAELRARPELISQVFQ